MNGLKRKEDDIYKMVTPDFKSTPFDICLLYYVHFYYIT